MHQAELLQGFAPEKTKPAEHTPRQQRPAVLGRASRGIFGLLFSRERAPAPENDRQEEKRAEAHAGSRKRKGTDVIHPESLRHKRAAPDGGGNQKQNRLSDLKKSHREKGQ